MASNERISYIDMIDVEHKNPSDMSIKRYYKFDKLENIERIKWCRRNFGQRGDGWDFTSTEICIWSSNLVTMYELCHL